MTAAKGNTPEDRKFYADGYRQAAFNLLHAARQLRDLTEELSYTKVKVARPAIEDLDEARAILAALPDVAAKTTLEKV